MQRPLGDHPSFEIKSGKYKGMIYVKNVDIFVENTRTFTMPSGAKKTIRFTPEWCQQAIENAQYKFQSNGYLSPSHLGHNGKDGEEREGAGVFLPNRLDKVTYQGAPRMFVFADLIMPPNVWAQAKKLGLPYRSVEIDDPNVPMFSSLALLRSRPPFMETSPLMPYMAFSKAGHVLCFSAALPMKAKNVMKVKFSSGAHQLATHFGIEDPTDEELGWFDKHLKQSLIEQRNQLTQQIKSAQGSDKYNTQRLLDSVNNRIATFSNEAQFGGPGSGRYPKGSASAETDQSKRKNKSAGSVVHDLRPKTPKQASTPKSKPSGGSSSDKGFGDTLNREAGDIQDTWLQKAVDGIRGLATRDRNGLVGNPFTWPGRIMEKVMDHFPGGNPMDSPYEQELTKQGFSAQYGVDDLAKKISGNLTNIKGKLAGSKKFNWLLNKINEQMSNIDPKTGKHAGGEVNLSADVIASWLRSVPVDQLMQLSQYLTFSKGNTMSKNFSIAGTTAGLVGGKILVDKLAARREAQNVPEKVSNPNGDIFIFHHSGKYISTSDNTLKANPSQILTVSKDARSVEVKPPFRNEGGTVTGWTFNDLGLTPKPFGFSKGNTMPKQNFTPPMDPTTRGKAKRAKLQQIEAEIPKLEALIESYKKAPADLAAAGMDAQKPTDLAAAKKRLARRQERAESLKTELIELRKYVRTLKGQGRGSVGFDGEDDSMEEEEGTMNFDESDQIESKIDSLMQEAQSLGSDFSAEDGMEEPEEEIEAGFSSEEEPAEEPEVDAEFDGEGTTLSENAKQAIISTLTAEGFSMEQATQMVQSMLSGIGFSAEDGMEESEEAIPQVEPFTSSKNQGLHFQGRQRMNDQNKALSQQLKNLAFQNAQNTKKLKEMELEKEIQSAIKYANALSQGYNFSTMIEQEVPKRFREAGGGEKGKKAIKKMVATWKDAISFHHPVDLDSSHFVGNSASDEQDKLDFIANYPQFSEEIEKMAQDYKKIKKENPKYHYSQKEHIDINLYPLIRG